MNRISEKAADQIKAMPIFNPIMRDANRMWRKTNTRRPVKLPAWSTNDWKDYEAGDAGSSVFYPVKAYEPPLIIARETGCFAEIKCPYGYPGEIRYMREPLFKGPDDYAYYLDDFISGDLETPVHHAITGEKIKWDWKIETLSGLYMPKFAARTFMNLKSLRVEYLHDISDEDCIAEGVQKHGDKYAVFGLGNGLGSRYFLSKPRWAFCRLWESINGDESWYSNPLVWVIGYSKLADRGEIITI